MAFIRSSLPFFTGIPQVTAFLFVHRLQRIRFLFHIVSQHHIRIDGPYCQPASNQIHGLGNPSHANQGAILFRFLTQVAART